MKIIAINGSHRKGKNTTALLNTVLDEAQNMGCRTELLELTDLNIRLCKACNMCLKKSECSIIDDMKIVETKLLAADGIILGSPVYWMNVTTLMKNFMDRSRYLHITKNMLGGKVGAVVTNAGLLHGGQESTLNIMENFLHHHGLYIADSRASDSEIMTVGVTGSLMSGFKNSNIVWRRSAADDELIQATCKQLGRNMVNLIHKLNESF